MSELIFKQFRHEGCLAYLIADQESGEAAIIDPKKEETAKYVEVLKSGSFKLKYVIDTHTHADHVSSSCELAQECNAQVVMSEKTTSERLQVSVRAGSQLSLGAYALKFIEVPGHTSDSVAIEVKNYLFTGDSLLFDDCGRTDFPGGNSQEQYDSLYHIIGSYPDDTIIAPAHDYEERTLMTLGEIKESNESLKYKSKEEFVAYLQSWNLSLPKKLKESLTANRQHCFKLGGA
ncbi:MAG: MBL fold metallo-hydrolase [Deltaproteobacteria bacterium]|nr:MAG: MBL fold metallo-hydrolase [Deltaproteobacteria bacterium]